MATGNIAEVSLEYSTLSTRSMGAEAAQDYLFLVEVIYKQSFLKRMPAVVYKDSIISIISVVNAISLQFLCLGRYVCRPDIAKNQHRHKQTDQGEDENPQHLNYLLLSVLRSSYL
jgi:hypothetical protein